MKHFSNYPEAREIFIDSFELNYPDLVRDRNVISIDCTAFSDPDRNPALCKHIGHPPEILKGVVNSKDFVLNNEPLRYLK